MKTKFDSVVKLKKQQVEKIQNDIQKINKAVLELSSKIEELKASLMQLTLPKSGSFSKITQINTQKTLLRNEIQNLQNQINILNNRKNELLEELKKARIEYEKMKYLQGEEIKKQLKEIKLKESREMDEIAILLRNQSES
ncbi:flagellar export protein FliJ [Caminibacter pacificus]